MKLMASKILKHLLSIKSIIFINLFIGFKKILNKAIKAGGSTLRDYVSADGTLGNFQNKFKIITKMTEVVIITKA